MKRWLIETRGFESFVLGAETRSKARYIAYQMYAEGWSDVSFRGFMAQSRVTAYAEPVDLIDQTGDLFDQSGARFSRCKRWRYKLWRYWTDDERLLVCVGLNPSTATETVDDPTIRRVTDYARRWGLGGIVMLNAFGYRSTDPKGMLAADDPVGPGNKDSFDETLGKLKGRPAPVVLCMWGAHGTHMDQDEEVMGWLRWPDIQPVCLGVNANGTPKHPLYLPKDAEPFACYGRHAKWQGDTR